MTRRPDAKRAFHWDGRRTDVAADVDAELATHFAYRVEELVAQGWTPEAARAEARRRFGDVGATRRALRRLDQARVRGAAWSEWWDELRRDVRHAWRGLRRQPGFTAVVTLTLALGIGANAAIFSVLHGVLLRPLAFPDADRLVTLWTDNRVEGWPKDVSSYPNIADWRAQNDVFTEVAAYVTTGLTLTGTDVPERVRGVRAMPSLFPVLGVAPAHGRAFDETDVARGQRVVVISDGFWRRRLGARADVLGRTLRLNGEPHTVVGVMPPGFAFPTPEVEAWVPFPPDIADQAGRGALWLEAIARLKRDVPLERARAAMTAVARRLEQQYPDVNENLGVNVVPLHEHVVGPVRTPLLVLMGAVGLVLLIACANVANLVLVRSAGRREELAVRAALGAGRGRLARQLVTESLLLAALGAALGLALAVLGVRLILALAPGDIPRLDAVRLDGTVLLFTLGVGVLTAVLFGAPAAVRATGLSLGTVLRSGARDSGSVTARRVRGGLVVAQLALALTLLAGAGLLLESFRRLQRQDAGFRPDGVLTARLTLVGARYDEPSRGVAFQQALLERVRALPGVREAGVTSGLPLDGPESGGPITVEGRAPDPSLDAKSVRFTAASPGYMEALGMTLRRGRTFAETDLGPPDSVPGVAMVNETLARLYFDGADPVGRRVKFGGRDGDSPWMTIVGLVADSRQTALDVPTRPELFFSSLQRPRRTLSLVLRTDGDPAALAPAVRRVVAALDPELALSDVAPMSRLWADALAGRRFNTALVTAFAGLALVLAVVGIYGVMSYAVSERRRELGIRLAVGADGDALVRLVLRDALLLVVVGAAAGLLLALPLSRVLGSLLVETRTGDPLLLGGTALLLVGTALLASWLPARRAARVDPLLVLRGE